MVSKQVTYSEEPQNLDNEDAKLIQVAIFGMVICCLFPADGELKDSILCGPRFEWPSDIFFDPTQFLGVYLFACGQHFWLCDRLSEFETDFCAICTFSCSCLAPVPF